MYRYKLLAICIMMIVEVRSQNLSLYLKSVRDCLSSNNSAICVKEETLDLLNETIYSDEPIRLLGNINISRNKEYIPEFKQEAMPLEASQRSLVLNDAILSRIEDFFKSRLIQFKIADSSEGIIDIVGYTNIVHKKHTNDNSVSARKGGGGGFGGGGGGGGKKGGGSGVLVLIGVAMAGVLSQLFMGKIALVAGAALLMSKIALMITLLSSLKKSSGDGGGKESAHVVYTSSGGDSYSHSHGGWHRSLTHGNDPQQLAYNGYVQTNTNSYR
ncbi:hypothetical protein MML48_5g00002976 [Holotrichia oblita]|uniref:Uncharacterized protein n=1 Tax=Holotrichia oblita TaxID=644536 RepID=A0ACB9T4P0_HOLOL|nr:hypothetical protein MML48_5g00002976 [Holotrichia oblita]